MPNWNPNFPEVLGNEWMLNHDQKNRVWSGAPGRMDRKRSTSAETIGSLKMSASVDPHTHASVPTLIDVMVEGNEFTAQPNIVNMLPNVDRINTGWVTEAGGSSNVFNSINDDTTQWPSVTTETTWLQTTGNVIDYAAGFDTSLFNGGAAANGRIFWVGVGAILGANTGIRKLETRLRIGGAYFPPAGGSRRDVTGYGALYSFFWGEINPSTLRPWTPAEIALFGTDATWGVMIRSVAASAAQFPKIIALSLNVAYLNTENRVAVGVWRRPESIGTSKLINVTTDTLRTMPAGTANWSKATNTNYLFFWRQSASPSQYGPIVADDVRWNGGYQDLTSDGNPPGVVYPLSFSGTPPPGATGLASEAATYDTFGRPQTVFSGKSPASYALAMITTAPAESVDSQPYRLDLADLAKVTPTQKLGQRLVPASGQTYLGARFTVIPPATGNPTLTVAVVRISDQVQIGGTFTITASAARSMRALNGSNDWTYVTGFLSSAAALVISIPYELRFTTDSGEWLMAMPDCSLAPTASFGGNTSGAFIGATHDTNRDLSAVLLRQPNPATGATAAIINVPVLTYLSAQGVPLVQHVRVSWSVPGSGMAGLFKRYELDRSLDGGTIWFRIAHLNNAVTASFDDHEVPRDTSAIYRIRAVGLDGRFSTYAQTGAVKPTGPGEIVIFTCNHDTTKEVVYFSDHDSTYPLLSAAGDETVLIHGANRQVVFMETEDRGIGWHTGITIDKMAVNRDGGHKAIMPLVNTIRSLSIPYVCTLDDRGTQILGHVQVTEADRSNSTRYYTADINAIPTHDAPVPVEVP